MILLKLTRIEFGKEIPVYVSIHAIDAMTPISSVTNEIRSNHYLDIDDTASLIKCPQTVVYLTHQHFEVVETIDQILSNISVEEDVTHGKTYIDT